jgi:hypothetical protein
MTCKFEQVGKDWRIEIPPIGGEFSIFALFQNIYGPWCICSFFANLIWRWQGAEVDLWPSLIGSASSLILLGIGWFKENPSRNPIFLVRDFLAYFTFLAVWALIFVAIWPIEERLSLALGPRCLHAW